MKTIRWYLMSILVPVVLVGGFSSAQLAHAEDDDSWVDPERVKKSSSASGMESQSASSRKSESPVSANYLAQNNGKKDAEFLGVYAGESYPVSSCKIVKASSLISITDYAFMNQTAYDDLVGTVQRLSQKSLDYFAQKAKQGGYNAVINFQFSWLREGSSNSFVVFRASGNPVLVNCDK